ncbi:MAG: hypothetical protein HOC20_10760 [Chloroflexi bacterium]|nr:hypothetical protein [Chloroflexota bacterium]
MSLNNNSFHPQNQLVLKIGRVVLKFASSRRALKDAGGGWALCTVLGQGDGFWLLTGVLQFSFRDLGFRRAPKDNSERRCIERKAWQYGDDLINRIMEEGINEHKKW